MRRIIRIFLASSIVEFANERMAIENFIRNISDKFEENYDVKIQPLLCENFDDAYSKIRKQEEYNEKICNSDLCFFIFFTKAGEYTREEFEVARKKFEETGKPKIYTYFKVLKDETAEQSLYDFMDELDKIFGHYYGTFEHIDTIKLRILLNLKLQEMDFLEIKVDGDSCVVDGEKVLSLEKVAEFANNSIFQDLKVELYEVEEKYFNLKAKYEKDECSQNEEREYIEIASKRQNLIDTIEDIQKNIFNMSLRMCQDEARGEITLRQKEAYRLFEAGDLEGANNILDFAEIKNDYQRRKAIREAEQKKDAQIFIREGRTKIDILTMMSNLSMRFDEIEEIYDEIVDVAFQEKTELSVIYEFALFLYEQIKLQKAIDITEKLNDIYLSNKMINEIAYAKLLNLMSLLYERENDTNKAISCCLGAIKILRNHFELNQEYIFTAFITSCCNVAIIYSNHNQETKAEQYFAEAINLGENLSSASENVILALAGCYNNAALFFRNFDFNKAEQYYFKSLNLMEQLTRNNSQKFLSELAECYTCSSFFVLNKEKEKEALFKAKDIREYLSKENPLKYQSELANTYNNIAFYYDNNYEPEKAEKYYLLSIKINERLINFSATYKSELAINYNNLAVFYKDEVEFEQAEKYFLLAIKIWEFLAHKNPERYNSSLAEGYCNISRLYMEKGIVKEAKVYFEKSINLYEMISKHNIGAFAHCLAECYFYLWKINQDKFCYSKFQFFFEKVKNDYVREGLIMQLGLNDEFG